MEALELRIGNLIELKHTNNPLKIAEILKDSVSIAPQRESPWQQIPFEYVVPIPLTEEWLMKFSFNKQYFPNPFEDEEPKLNKDGTRYYHWVHGLFNMEIQSNGEIWFEVYNHYIHVKYVHQLQNLYFALSEQELKLK